MDVYENAARGRRIREVADVDSVSYVVPQRVTTISAGRDAAGLASGFTARKPRRIVMHCKSTTMAHGTRSLLFLTVIWARRLTTQWLA